MSGGGLRRWVDRTLETLLVVLMGVMVLNVLWQVFTRFILASPSPYTEELARYLLIWVSLLGAAYGVGRRMHLAIDVFTSRLTGTSKRISETFIQLTIVLFALLVMGIGGSYLVYMTLALQQVSAALQVRLGYVYLAIPLSGLFILFYSGTHLARLLGGRIERVEGKETPEIHGAD